MGIIQKFGCRLVPNSFIRHGKSSMPMCPAFCSRHTNLDAS
jgi:hypothetical protein